MMYKTYKDLPNDIYKKRIMQYRYDYFFHYLLIHMDSLRVFLCRYLSKDHSIQETFVDYNDDYLSFYDGKKLILDVVVYDDKGRYYDFEMQNDSIDEADMVRFMRYGERLLTRQEKKGLLLDSMKNVYQMIFYTGQPIFEYMHYKHYLRKGDIENRVLFRGDKVTTLLMQLKLMEEDVNMEKPLNTLDQIAYLFYNDKPHLQSQTSKLVDEIVELHKAYIASDEAIKAYELELERALIKSRERKAEERGEKRGEKRGMRKGKQEERLNNVKTMIQSVYHEDASDWLSQCQDEQLQKSFILIGKRLSYQEFQEEILK